MKKFLKAFAGAFCAMTILFTGVSVFAAENDKTPTGIPYDRVGATIEKWAKENPDEYVSFVTAVFSKAQLI